MMAGVGAAACVGVYGWRIEPTWLRVQHRSIRLLAAPERWRGRTILHASDLHIGKTDPDYLASVARKINELKPDLIALTGDFINHDRSHAIEHVRDWIGQLRHTTLGAVACLGNHDYGRRWSQTDVAQRVADAIESEHVKVLRNQTRSIDGVDVVGLDDYWSVNFDPVVALREVSSERDAICLCHNPDVCDEPVWGQFRGHILAGHTHGGQCKAPFLPPPMLPVKNRRYVEGEIDLGAGRTLHISRGVGYLRRVRFNVRPELTLLHVQNV